MLLPPSTALAHAGVCCFQEQVSYIIAAMIRRSLRDGFPVIVPIRQDATPEELEAALGAVTRLIQEAGLAA